jgi:adenine phosphoribosyltransferase
MAMTASELAATIRSVPGFPKPGIVFRDITTLLKDPLAFKAATEILAQHYRTQSIDKVVGIESRGFILGATLALNLGAGFVPIRKKGKLPAETLREEYALEYGLDAIEIHTDAIVKGERVLLHDDLLATGGTMAAAVSLVERLGGVVAGIAFLVELEFLNGRDHLKGREIVSLIRVEKE